jgi:hypothetical protein
MANVAIEQNAITPNAISVILAPLDCWEDEGSSESAFSFSAGDVSTFVMLLSDAI